jgi:hypothetical protein
MVGLRLYIPPVASARWMGHPNVSGWVEERQKQIPPLRYGMTNKAELMRLAGPEVVEVEDALDVSFRVDDD